MNIINSLNMKAFGLIFLISILIYSLPINTTKGKNPICDSEKQSKFILDCIKEDKTKDVRAFGACENMSIKLYCK
jgi:hypothetical protein